MSDKDDDEFFYKALNSVRRALLDVPESRLEPITEDDAYWKWLREQNVRFVRFLQSRSFSAFAKSEDADLEAMQPFRVPCAFFDPESRLRPQLFNNL